MKMSDKKTSAILVTKPDVNYELIDSGHNEKLERFGKIIMSRPDPQALWPKRLEESEWKKADAYFLRNEEKAEWKFREAVSTEWPIEFGGLKFLIKPTAFKHTGLFPEQLPNWNWMRELIHAQDFEIEVLNLFGYTGGASLACAQAGAKVVHIDSSKSAVAWARQNAELSGLSDKPIRWIVEDARLFVGREIKRGRKYDAIVMDPPAFGHGLNNELWKIEEHFLSLIEDCKKLLKPKPLFFLINGYSAGYSAIAYENNLLSLQHEYGGSIEIGELAIEEGVDNKHGIDVKDEDKQIARLLPAGIFARWSGL